MKLERGKRQSRPNEAFEDKKRISSQMKASKRNRHNPMWFFFWGFHITSGVVGFASF
jgi:hypothetical protein